MVDRYNAHFWNVEAFHEPWRAGSVHLAQPFQGCEDPSLPTQGSLGPSRTGQHSATLGFEAESLWDSRFEVHGHNACAKRNEAFDEPWRAGNVNLTQPFQGCENPPPPTQGRLGPSRTGQYSPTLGWRAQSCWDCRVRDRCALNEESERKGSRLALCLFVSIVIFHISAATRRRP